MTFTATSQRPSAVGDLIEIDVTWTPPTGSDAVVTAAQMLTRSPSGTEAAVDGVALADNVWRFTADDRIDEAGTWAVRVNANAGMFDSYEVFLEIAPSMFDAPLPPP
jgi:hypothetical protein